MLLGGNSSFLEKLIIPPVVKEEMRPSNTTPTLTEKEEEDIDAFPTTNSETERKIEMLRNVVGEDVPTQRIKHVLHGADGDVEIALNHLLNDLEKDRPGVKSESNTPTVSRSPSMNSLTPSATEKLLYELAEEVKCPLCLSYFTNPVILNCFHTFCSTCVEDILGGDNKVTCPMCRIVIELDDRGVRGLRQNHYLANIVEKLKSAQNTKMCDECRSSLCTVVCKQCKAFLCISCNDKIHSIRLLYNHIRIPFEECFFTSKSSSLIGTELDINWETDLVIPFNVKKEVCTDLFNSWVKELWFAPSDLIKTAILQEFKMVYIPFWLFEVDTSSRYVIGFTDKLLGESSELGVYKQRYTDLMICASNCPESAMLEQIDPWKVDQIQPFTLRHSEGAEVQPFTMDVDTTWRFKAKQKVDQLNREACKKNLRYRVRTDNVCRMNIETTFANKKSRRLFVPIYSTIYEYHGNTYRFIVNGSTAKAYGNRPYSTSKLASLSFTSFGAAVGLFSSSRFNL